MQDEKSQSSRTALQSTHVNAVGYGVASIIETSFFVGALF